MRQRFAIASILLAIAMMAFSFLAPSAALAQQVPVRHVVRAGETLTAIAARYQTTVHALAEANGLTGTVIYPGQFLTVPLDRSAGLGLDDGSASRAGLCVPGAAYVLRQGDTLVSLASRWGTSPAMIKHANGLVGTVLWAGQSIKMVCASDEVAGNVASEVASSVNSLGFCGGVYSVRPGDTLSSVAVRCGVTVAELKNANGLVSNQLLVGQSLRIPTRAR